MNSRFVKGMITGVVVGSVVGMMFVPIKDRDKKNVKRRVSKMLRTAGNVLDFY